ncbi:MAG TPA: glycosyltransferase, partial [Candidatus Peribacteraceae bacterium]|nr:glycosyltransferase [Candidatus Peribacteraceae bacterium]
MQELTVIVPVYNEAATLRVIMDALDKACPDAQIVYVDDGSTDESRSILREHARLQDLVIEGNHGGKGSAIRLGLEHAAGAYTV